MMRLGVTIADTDRNEAGKTNDIFGAILISGRFSCVRRERFRACNCKKRLQNALGTITGESELGKGSVFQVVLPK